mmetsp:Transcript_11631/g.43091  ORF Transcript_11631/g.43091 Transcript_11631/m.43091 type:complete len:571 (+) Transcript_11631:545-2257(+)
MCCISFPVARSPTVLSGPCVITSARVTSRSSILRRSSYTSSSTSNDRSPAIDDPSCHASAVSASARALSARCSWILASFIARLAFSLSTISSLRIRSIASPRTFDSPLVSINRVSVCVSSSTMACSIAASSRSALCRAEVSLFAVAACSAAALAAASLASVSAKRASAAATLETLANSRPRVSNSATRVSRLSILPIATKTSVAAACISVCNKRSRRCAASFAATRIASAISSATLHRAATVSDNTLASCAMVSARCVFARCASAAAAAAIALDLACSSSSCFGTPEFRCVSSAFFRARSSICRIRNDAVAVSSALYRASKGPVSTPARESSSASIMESRIRAARDASSVFAVSSPRTHSWSRFACSEASRASRWRWPSTGCSSLPQIDPPPSLPPLRRASASRAALASAACSAAAASPAARRVGSKSRCAFSISPRIHSSSRRRSSSAAWISFARVSACFARNEASAAVTRACRRFSSTSLLPPPPPKPRVSLPPPPPPSISRFILSSALCFPSNPNRISSALRFASRLTYSASSRASCAARRSASSLPFDEFCEDENEFEFCEDENVF